MPVKDDKVKLITALPNVVHLTVQTSNTALQCLYLCFSQMSTWSGLHAFLLFFIV